MARSLQDGKLALEKSWKGENADLEDQGKQT
jgi:hypothetical protein